MTDLFLAQLQIRERTDSCVSDNGFCPDWIVHNFDRYVDPFFQHVYLTVVSVAIGFGIAFALALVAYRRRWLINPVTQVTGILYTVPSVAAFFLLLPITGRGNATAIIALVAYVLLIIFRNVLTGLDNVPAETKDAGRGMGLTDRQLLWKVEVPLALPRARPSPRPARWTELLVPVLEAGRSLREEHESPVRVPSRPSPRPEEVDCACNARTPVRRPCRYLIRDPASGSLPDDQLD